MTSQTELNVSFRGTEMETLFFEPTFTDEEVMSSFRVIPNVTTKRKLGYVGQLEKIVRKHTGCGFDPVGSMDIYDRTIETNKTKIDLSLCWEEFKETVVEEYFNKGVRMADISETMIVKALLSRVAEAAHKDNIRLFFFGNEAAADPSYDVMNGLFSVHAPTLVGNNEMVRINQGQSAYAPGDALELFKELDAKAKKQLKGLSNDMKNFYTDGDTYQALYDDLEQINSDTVGSSRVENGVERLYFRGKRVIPQYEWNTILERDFNLTNQHYLLLTTPKNLALATNTNDTEAKLEIGYDSKNEDVFIKSRYRLGGNYVHPDLMAIAY